MRDERVVRVVPGAISSQGIVILNRQVPASQPGFVSLLGHSRAFLSVIDRTVTSGASFR